MDTFNNPYMTAALRSDALDAHDAAVAARRDANQMRVDLQYADVQVEALLAQRTALLGLFVGSADGRVEQVRAALRKIYLTAARKEAERQSMDSAALEDWLARLPPFPMPAPPVPGELPLPSPTADAAAQRRIQELEQQLAIANANAAGIATQRNALRRALGAVDPRNATLGEEVQRQKYEIGVRTQAERQGLPSEAVAALLQS